MRNVRNNGWLIEEGVATADADKFYHLVGMEMALRGFENAMSPMNRQLTSEGDVAVFGSTSTSTNALLLSHRLGDQIYLELRSKSSEPVPQEEASAWTESATSAARDLSGPDPLHSWWAVIGPHPMYPPVADGFKEEVRLGRITLKSLECAVMVPVVDRSRASIRTTPATQSRTAMMVQGESPGYDSATAMREAAGSLNEILALLEISIDGYWELLQAPTPMTAPDSSDISDVVERGIHPKLIEVPTKVADFFALMNQPGWLRDTSLAFHQALALEAQFPSVALSQHVAGIERIGSEYVKLEHCEKCKSAIGAARRFKAAMTLCCGERAASALKSRLYGKRSKVAHEGELFAGEEKAGSPLLLPFYGRSAETDFLYDDLRIAREALRWLLKYEFGRVLPA